MSDVNTPAVIVEKQADLDRLAEDIRALDEKARATAKTAVELAMETGRKLLEAREIIEQDASVKNKDKAFGVWRETNFSSPGRTMREYMSLARAFDGKDIGQIPHTVLRELAAPKNEEIREAVFEELADREEVDIKEAKELITDRRISAGLEQPKPELTPEEQAQKRLGAMVDLFGIEQVKIWLDAFD
jgi:hypothetical protein